MLSTWRALGYYRHDWGEAFNPPGEGPEFVRIPTDYIPGVCLVLPKRREGGVDVCVSLERAQLERLRADGEFMSYFDLVAV